MLNKTKQTAIALMNPVAERGFVVNVFNIIGGWENYPLVFSLPM